MPVLVGENDSDHWCCLSQVGPEEDGELYCEVQEAETAHITCDDLKTESGADGDCEPSLVPDSATSNGPTGESLTHSEGSVCSHASDKVMTRSESFAAVDPASGEPSSQADGPADDTVCDSNKLTEDVSSMCANISSGVSHMDIDVSEEVARDATVLTGTST